MINGTNAHLKQTTDWESFFVDNDFEINGIKISSKNTFDL